MTHPRNREAQMTPPSNTTSMSSLAAKIKAAHAAVASAVGNILAHSQQAGEALVAAKATVPHGEWEAWLEEHCAMSKRTAQGYMRLWRHRGRLAKAQSVAHLGVSSALRLLAKPLREEPAPDVVGADPGDVAQILFNERGLWICLEENGHGFRVITPSATHDGYAYVDHVSLGDGDDNAFVEVARRPIRYEALPDYYLGTKWWQLEKASRMVEVLRDIVPERVPDIERLAA